MTFGTVRYPNGLRDAADLSWGCSEISDVRIHDLRHMFAISLVSGGASLDMIGRLLGHTQIGTTQRYAHLIDSPLHARVCAVAEMLKPRLQEVGDNRRFGRNAA